MRRSETLSVCLWTAGLSWVLTGFLLIVVGVSQSAGPFGFTLFIAAVVALPGIGATVVAMILFLLKRRTDRGSVKVAIVGVLSIMVGVVAIPTGAAIVNYREEQKQEETVSVVASGVTECANKSVRASSDALTRREVGELPSKRSRLLREVLECMNTVVDSRLEQETGWQVSCGDLATRCQISAPNYTRGPNVTLIVPVTNYLNEALIRADKGTWNDYKLQYEEPAEEAKIVVVE